MSTPSPPRSPTVDSTPLLGDQFSQSRRFVRGQSLRGAARFLRRAGSSRGMNESSMRVRESAAEQLEERRNDWAYSKPIVALDIVWNLGFVALSAVVLVLSRNESASEPLRLWILGYALQCVLHMVCVVVEYRRRSGFSLIGEDLNSSSGSDGGGGGEYESEPIPEENRTSVAKHLESANTLFSFIWWIIGFYWVSSGGDNLIEESPQLYWLCIVFLAFDVAFVVICVVVACLIGVAVCCCLPCIIAILYTVTDQEGATKEEIDQLPKYKFRKIGDFEKQNGEIQESFGGIMTQCDTDSPIERVLTIEDAECCICISAYDDGAELHELPCHHHFHCACVDKWLYINAVCPLCKFNILKNGNPSGPEDA